MITIRLIVPLPGKIKILENAAIFLDYQIAILIRERVCLCIYKFCLFVYRTDFRNTTRDGWLISTWPRCSSTLILASIFCCTAWVDKTSDVLSLNPSRTAAIRPEEVLQWGGPQTIRRQERAVYQVSLSFFLTIMNR